MISERLKPMNKEILFAKKLEEIVQLARSQGNSIREEQVREAFAELDFSAEQLQMVYDYLLQHKIGIGQPLPEEDYLSDEEKDYLSGYLQEVEELPAYTEGERLAFTIQAMAGEPDAQNKLVESYLKEVPGIAKLYAGQGVFLEDLIGEGNVALAMGVTMLGSLEKPEEAQGMLMKLVMDAMEEDIKEKADVKQADRRLADKVNQVAEKAKELSEELHRKVTVEELVSETKLTEKSIRDALRMSGNRIEYIEAE